MKYFLRSLFLLSIILAALGFQATAQVPKAGRLNQSRSVRYEMGSRLMTSLPPAVPQLISPADSAVSIATSPLLVWHRVDSAASYVLTWAADSGLTTPFSQTLTDTTYQLTGLAAGRTYFWRVYAVSSQGNGPVSATWIFTTIGLPGAPKLVRPVRNSINQPLASTLKWRKASVATSYTVEWAMTPNFLSASTLTLADTSVALNLNPNTSYYWRVQAANVNGTGPWSEVWAFTTEVPLPANAPVHVSPVSGSIIPGNRVTVRWNKVLYAESYVVDISTDPIFYWYNSSPFLFGDTAYTYNNLPPNTTLYWRVKARNGAGVYSALSKPWRFTTGPAQPPAAPGLIVPANGSLSQPLNLELFWNKSVGATSYDVEWSTNSSFSNASTQTVSDTSLKVGMLFPGTTYYWRVLASNSIAGNGAFSPSFTFTTQFPQVFPSAPILASPSHNSTNQPLVVQLNWRPVTNQTGYEVQISSSPSFLSATNIARADTFWTTPTLAYNATYYWRVRGTNTAGPGDWSNEHKFHTKTVAALQLANGQQWTLYPNPAQAEVHIDGLQQPAPFMLVNSLGQTVRRGTAQPDQPISLRGLAPGHYQVLIQAADNKLLRQSLIIE